MKTLVVLLTWSICYACTSAFAQSSPGNNVPQSGSVPAASAVPSGTAARPQKNQGRGRGGKRLQQQPPVLQQDQPGATPQASRRQNQLRRGASERPAINYAQATQRQHHQRHDRAWWKSRYTTIVFVTGCGYYYWDAGYWFPAFGYDPRYEYFEFNGPIYTYGNLLPDQVIYNVQRALKELGYYSGPLSGSLSPSTRAAINAFQEDNGLDVTGGIDGPTVEALGLY
jgi:hypothetical protein